MYDLARNERKRLTSNLARQRAFVWSHDGKRLVFSSSRGGHYDLYQMAASGEGSAELLYASDDDKFATSWSPDGKFLAYETRRGATIRDAGSCRWKKPARVRRYRCCQTAAADSSAAFSPAGRWIAYDSDSSGTQEVYVQEFAPAVTGYLAGPKVQVSRGGGSYPHWRADGKELFYFSPDRRVMSVAVSPGTTFQPGLHSECSDPHGDLWKGDPEGDGKRFLFAFPAEHTGPQPFTVVLNWQAELKK